MYFSLKLAAVSALALGASASQVVWVTETAYTCPCSSSVSTKLSSVLSTTTTSAKTTMASAKPTTYFPYRSTSILSSFPSTTSGLASCIPLGGDCTDETNDYYCCGNYSCEIGLDTPTCVSDDNGSDTTTTPTMRSTMKTTSSSTTSSATSAGTCIPLGGDCTNETNDYYCCGNYSCDVGLDTPTCVSD